MDKYYNRSNAILPYYDIGIIYAGNKTSILFPNLFSNNKHKELRKMQRLHTAFLQQQNQASNQIDMYNSEPGCYNLRPRYNMNTRSNRDVVLLVRCEEESP